MSAKPSRSTPSRPAGRGAAAGAEGSSARGGSAFIVTQEHAAQPMDAAPRARSLVPGLAAGAALLALIGCAQSGDFGRPRPSVWNDLVLPTAGSVVAASRGEPVSWFVLTDDERELRARAWRFLMPAHERQFFERQLAELARTRVIPAAAGAGTIEGYYAALSASAERSPAPLFRRIGEDAAADRLLLASFLSVGERVTAGDRARLELLLRVAELGEDQARGAAARIAENSCLIAWVGTAALMRAQRYRYALERMAVEAPQRQAAAAERALLALEDDLALFSTAIPLGAACDGRLVPRSAAVPVSPPVFGK